jgi:hypothetical protein
MILFLDSNRVARAGMGENAARVKEVSYGLARERERRNRKTDARIAFHHLL